MYKLGDLVGRSGGSRTGGGGMSAGGRTFGIRSLGYMTNHIVSHLPSYALRHHWYRALGLRLGSGVGVQLDLNLSFNGPGQLRRSGASIGAGTRINRGCRLDARGGLVIGEHVSVSPEVVILTADHDRDAPGFPLRQRPVVIEDHVWIGMRAMILPGVRVGRGSVVAAGAVVTRDVAPLTVVAGIPARPVGRRLGEALDYVLDEPLPLFE